MKFFLCILISLATFGEGFAFRVSYATSTVRPMTPVPPPYRSVAQMARYIIHYSDWATVSHISFAENTTGYPQARVFSMSDGPLTKGGSTGVPYFYTTLLEPGTSDLLTEDPRSSVTASLAQNSYCKQHYLDVEDPRCAQVMLSGNFTKIEKNSKEWNLAQTALFTRHPQMKSFPKNHNFFFAKLDIHEVQVVDYFGGSQYPSVGDYFRSQPPYEKSSHHSMFEYSVHYVA